MSDPIESTTRADELEALKAKVAELEAQQAPADDSPRQYLDFVIDPPKRSDPGYMRRQRRMVMFAEMQRTGQMSVEAFDEMVEFLLDFVASPDRDTARDLILDELNEDQIEGLMAAIRGDGNALPEA